MTGLESFPATHLVMQLSSANFSRTLLAAAAVAWLHAAVRWLAAVAVNDRVSRSYEYGFLFS